MEYMGCYDSVIEMVDAGTEEFFDCELNEKKFNSLKGVCEMTDRLVEEIEDCEGVDVSIDEHTKQLTIGILCYDVIFQHGRENVFFSLIQMLSSFSFSKAKGGFLRINLNIDGIWEEHSGC